MHTQLPLCTDNLHAVYTKRMVCTYKPLHAQKRLCTQILHAVYTSPMACRTSPCMHRSGCTQRYSMLYTQDPWHAIQALACTEPVVHRDTPCCIHKTHGMHANPWIYTQLVLYYGFTLVYRQVILYYGFTLVSFPELACVIT